MRYPLAHPADGLRDRGHVAQAHVEELGDSTVGNVGMAVDEPRSGCTAVQIDASGPWAGEPQDLMIRADRDDLAAAHRHGLGNGVLGVDREHGAVDQDQIGRESRAVVGVGTKGRLCGQGQQREGGEHAAGEHAAR